MPFLVEIDTRAAEHGGMKTYTKFWNGVPYKFHAFVETWLSSYFTGVNVSNMAVVVVVVLMIRNLFVSHPRNG